MDRSVQSQVCLRREFQREGAATEGSVTPGLVLGPGWWIQEVGIRGVEPSGRSVTMEQLIAEADRSGGEREEYDMQQRSPEPWTLRLYDLRKPRSEEGHKATTYLGQAAHLWALQPQGEGQYKWRWFWACDKWCKGHPGTTWRDLDKSHLGHHDCIPVGSTCCSICERHGQNMETQHNKFLSCTGHPARSLQAFHWELLHRSGTTVSLRARRR
ncbi:uncharacterized protein LOC121896714 [Thunnus maccoyii]|uniref:uncharacterized protein LOC121896714 n=1 Tax=Thunnus maccoyii TaxID=8240 RepID=UPI001C4A7674|nr:uncharacterized protein LOC121896714 [Thunnus maccoyii]